MGEETQMGCVEQSLGSVAEIAGQQFGDQTSVGRIRHRQQYPPVRGQQLGQLRENRAGLAQMLHNIGAEDEIVTLASEIPGQRDAFKIGAFQLAVPGRRLRHSHRVVFNPVHRAPERFGQVTAQHTRAGAQIQHPAAGSDLAGKSGQRILTLRVQGAMINMSRGNIRHGLQSCFSRHHADKAPAGRGSSSGASAKPRPGGETG